MKNVKIMADQIPIDKELKRMVKLWAAQNDMTLKDALSCLLSIAFEFESEEKLKLFLEEKEKIN